MFSNDYKYISTKSLYKYAILSSKLNGLTYYSIIYLKVILNKILYCVFI